MAQVKETIWDTVVIGGGPAGMMAAGRAAERGAKVLLLEKNDGLGKKLLITGGGRCNVTNYELDVRKFLSKFKTSDKFLFSAFSKWSVEETLKFFHDRSMETKVEAFGRVFPLSNKAESVWNVLTSYLKESGVVVQSKSEVKEILHENNIITSVLLKNNEKIFAHSFILATGGKSRPETGSTGDGFNWLKALGHGVTEPDPALVPIRIKDEWVKRIPGVSLNDVKVTLLQNNTKQGVRRGRILFTHFGLTGPTILNLSKDISDLLKYGEVYLSLDAVPNLDHGMLNETLQKIFQEESNKKIKNSLGTLIPSALVSPVLNSSDINEDLPCNSITREQRLALIQSLKNLGVEVEGLLGADKAIVTSGGVALTEVDFRTMQSKLFSNLYLIGDILHIDRPSGGYSLQLCWTTGFIAGDSVTILKK